MMRRAMVTVALVGLLLPWAAPAARAELIVNGGFETGDFTGWTVVASPFNTSVIGNSPPDTFAGFQSKAGTHFAALGESPNLGTLSQTVSDTPGLNYILSMYLGTDGQGNEFKVQWNGNTIYDQVNIPNITPPGESPFRYMLLSFTVQGTGTDTLILSEEAEGFLALDAVSLNAAPAPTPAVSSHTAMLMGAGLLLLGPWSVRRVARRR